MDSKVRFHEPYSEQTDDYGSEDEDEESTITITSLKPDDHPLNRLRDERPSLTGRNSSNTYAPNRTPSQGNIAKEELPHRPSYHARNRSTSSAKKSAFKAQERAYVQKLQQEPDNDYYEAGLGKFQLTTSDDDADSEVESEYGNGQDEFDDRVTAVTDDYQTIFSSADDQALSVPENRERLEWLTMLASVLTGEVVKSEKKRLSGNVGTTEDGKLTSEIWIGLRAKALGRDLLDQKRIVEDARAQMDATLEEVSRFQIRGTDQTSLSPPEQVAEVLEKVEICESMYPSRAEMIAAKPIVASESFTRNMDSLTSWTTITNSIHTAIEILRKWTGNDELDVTQSSGKGDDSGISDESSFIERILKENGLQRTFEKKSLSNIDLLVSKAKETMIENSATFAAMHLPPYLDELLLLINFPTKLIEEALKLRLVYAKKLDDPTMLMVDQMIEDFVMLLNVAVEIKGQYVKNTTPQLGWHLPPCIDENFDAAVLDALKFYFKLLNWKLGSNSKAGYFKEAEILETEYDFLDSISKYVDGGDVIVAEQFRYTTSHKNKAANV